jgi:hypothetical protein
VPRAAWLCCDRCASSSPTLIAQVLRFSTPLNTVYCYSHRFAVGFKEATLPNHPTDESKGKRTLPFTNVIYIEQTDFRLDDDPNYYGLAPGKTVGLRYAGNITVDKVDKDADGKPTTLHATLDTSKTVKVGVVRCVRCCCQAISLLPVFV